MQVVCVTRNANCSDIQIDQINGDLSLCFPIILKSKLLFFSKKTMHMSQLAIKISLP